MPAAAVALVALALQADGRAVLVVPNTPDLTIRVRTTAAGRVLMAETLRFKGARRWSRRTFGRGGADAVATYITQCDERRQVILNPQTRLFASIPLQEPDDHHIRPPGGAAPADVRRSPTHQIVIDAVDTGERRQFASLTARHVVTTTTEMSPAAPHPAITVEDGWYVDLPLPDCVDRGDAGATLFGFAGPAGDPPAIPTIIWRGRAKRGFPLIQTIRNVGTPWERITKVELLEISASPIDPAVFEIPSDYRPALPLGDRDFDLSRADTVFNRAWLLWSRARDLAARLWPR